MKNVQKNSLKTSVRKASSITGGKSENLKMPKQATGQDIGKESNPGLVLSGNGIQELERTLPTNIPALPVPGNSSKMEVGKVGFHKQLSAEKITKRPMDSDDEIPVDFDSPEEKDEDLGTYENAENLNPENVDEEV